MRKRCVEILAAALADPSPFVGAHAGEALALTGHPDPALAFFRPKSETAGPEYRIVVWRVLARAEPDPAVRRRSIERIRKALLDPDGPDRTHAMEALAKLNEPWLSDDERRYTVGVADGKGLASPFAVWRLAEQKDASAVPRLLDLVTAEDRTTRFRAAYVIGRLGNPSSTTQAALANALDAEPADSIARPVLQASQGRSAARALADSSSISPDGKSARYFAAMYLADHGDVSDLPWLESRLTDTEVDVRVAAAFATLRVQEREGSRSGS